MIYGLYWKLYVLTNQEIGYKSPDPIQESTSILPAVSGNPGAPFSYSGHKTCITYVMCKWSIDMWYNGYLLTHLDAYLK